MDSNDRGQFEGKKILITGGLGFIGSNLARRLVELGAEVLLVDSLIPDYGGNLFNIDGLESKLRINIADVRDDKPICKLKTTVRNANGDDCVIGTATTYTMPLKNGSAGH